MSRPIALLAAAGSAFDLYQRAYGSAAGLALIASVAFVSMKSAPKPSSPSVKRVQRSHSAPDLTKVYTAPPIRQIELLPISEGGRPIFLSPPPPPPSSGFRPKPMGRVRKIVQLSDLPRANWAVWKFKEYFSLDRSASFVSGIIDSRGLKFSEGFYLDLTSHFGTSPVTFEVGDVEGAAERSRLRGGGWVVFTRDPALAHQIRSTSSSILIILGSVDFVPSSFNRIDIRNNRSNHSNELLFHSLLHYPTSLRDGGELRLIFRRGAEALSSFERYSNHIKLWESVIGTHFSSYRKQEEGDEEHLIFTRKGDGGAG